MNNYYLLCSYILRPGSIIEPGNWGRMLRAYPTNYNNLRIERENMYDKVRSSLYPDRPSRLKALFLCETLEHAKDFRTETNRIFDIIYSVRLIKSDAVVFKTDWKKMKIIVNEDIQIQEARAKEYWEGTNIEKLEVLTLSPVEIVEAIA